MAFDAWQLELHGHRVIYRTAGNGPPVVLIHGMVNSSRHWERVALRLADRYTVIAPDLIGHGDSATPRGDYSLGAHAAVIRDLLAVLGIERATIVGHSLGGGVAMQFFYQFPQRVERLVLVSSGGLGHEVSPLLRTAALPGASMLLSAAANRRVLAAVAGAGTRLRQRGSGSGVYLQAIARALRPLEQPAARQAFLQTLRAVIDVRGQRVSATDRLYLLHAMPTLIVWGERDHTIPLAHGRAAHAAAPGSRFETLPRAAHFPHLEDPEGLAAVLGGWLDTTPAARIEDGDWGGLLAPHSRPSRPPALTG
jgi:pimeloyl-ACP methyl ester carboxylesterase